MPSPAVKKEIQRRKNETQRGQSPPITWPLIWAWVVTTYGEDTQLATMEELRALRPENRGKLTADAWLTYAAEFRLRHARLENPRAEEVQDLILSNAPDSTRTSFFRDLAQKEQYHPSLRLTGLADIPPTQVEALLQQLLGGSTTARHLRVRPKEMGCT